MNETPDLSKYSPADCWRIYMGCTIKELIDDHIDPESEAEWVLSHWEGPGEAPPPGLREKLRDYLRSPS